jgi:hypothetical protein
MKTRHMLIMLLCCLIPLAALAAIFLFHIPVSTVGYAALFLICPLSHLFMMKFMMGGHSHSEDKATSDYGDERSPQSLPLSEHHH